jgi:hypothetical protein
MPLSFVFIQLLRAEQEESIGNRNGSDQDWVRSRYTMADILLVPGIGLVEAAQLAVDDVHGAVENAHQLASKFLWFHKAEDKGSEPDPKKPARSFMPFWWRKASATMIRIDASLFLLS